MSEILADIAAGNGCAKCGAIMCSGVAILNTYTGIGDFIGDKYPCTISAGGSGELVNCLKCTECGWSVL